MHGCGSYSVPSYPSSPPVPPPATTASHTFCLLHIHSPVERVCACNNNNAICMSLSIQTWLDTSPGRYSSRGRQLQELLASQHLDRPPPAYIIKAALARIYTFILFHVVYTFQLHPAIASYHTCGSRAGPPTSLISIHPLLLALPQDWSAHSSRHASTGCTGTCLMTQIPFSRILHQPDQVLSTLSSLFLTVVATRSFTACMDSMREYAQAPRKYCFNINFYMLCWKEWHKTCTSINFQSSQFTSYSHLPLLHIITFKKLGRPTHFRPTHVEHLQQTVGVVQGFQ